MKLQTKQTIQVGSVATDRKLRLDALFNMFQEAAVQHSREVGVPLNSYLDLGKTWVLSKVAVQLAFLPELDQTVEISTWSRGISRFKGFRDYDLRIDGRPVVTASSLWIYLDVARGRPVRAPDSFEKCFRAIPERATEIDLEALSFPEITRPDHLLDVATRVSDYDINGHVNNAVMLQYVQTALVRFLGSEVFVRDIRLNFQKEIPLAINKVFVVLQKSAEGCILAIQSDSQIFVRGCVAIGPT